MAASSRRSSGPVLRSHSPSSRFTSFYASQSHSPSSSSSSAFAYSSSGFSSRSTFFNQPRSTSPPRVNLHRNSSSASSVRFSLDNRPISPNRSITTVRRTTEALKNLQSKQTKRTCMCSPTTHPGSFRCSLHKSFNTSHAGTGYAPSNRLNARRSAMTNSLVRIGGVEGDLVRRALSALIRPSSHQQRRREAFHPRPSRLSVMSSPRFSGDLRSSFGVTPRSVAVKSDSGDDVGDFGQRIRTDLS
ncbi:hypothetical protein Goari_011547 [Gossypium aridum]|uniref:Serine-rich protein-like protein n=1 Tax=Gossypium aridum TaxID=34290 RepID=A0A7J8WZ25_GOSAI|nr:hypothetical protein [Gossypium aridum]